MYFIATTPLTFVLQTSGYRLLNHDLLSFTALHSTEFKICFLFFPVVESAVKSVVNLRVKDFLGVFMETISSESTSIENISSLEPVEGG